MRIWLAHLHPTIMRLNSSTMKQTYATPAQVGTNVRSVTQSLFGAVAANSRHQVWVSRGSRIGPGRLDPLRERCALDAGSAHQPTGLVAADVDPVAASGLPELANTIDAGVVPPEPHQFRGEDSVADCSRKRGSVFRGLISTRSHL